MSKRGTAKFLLGAGIGAGVALLLAPKKGEELRKDLLGKISDICDKLKEIDEEEVKENIESKVNEIKEGIKDLDKEKVKKIAKKKGEELKTKAEDLVEYAKEKGTPVIEKTAKKIKKSTAGVVREVLDKLEDENEK